MEHWPPLVDDEWRTLTSAMLADFDADGTVHREPIEPVAARLKALLDAGKPAAGTQPTHGPRGLTLRAGVAEAPDAHFKPKPSALAALTQTFLPPTTSTAEATTAVSSKAAPTAAAAAAAPKPGGGDSTARAGSGVRTAGSTGPLMSARPRPPGAAGSGGGASSSSSSAPRLLSTGAGAKPRLGGGAAAAAAAAKRSRMKMMDVDEANSMLLATNKPPEKKKQKLAAGASAGEKSRPDPFAGACIDAPSGLVHYFQDRLKKWTYVTSEAGGALLRGMFAIATPLISRVLDELAVGKEGEGKRLYAQKPNLGANGVTWSQDDYGHRGLQAEYLRLKSIQRFTEGWCAMQRAYNAGAFTHLMGDGAPGSVPFRVASLGGGPGFELVACRAFCEKHLPMAKLDLISLDLAKEWRDCAEGLGLRFGHWCVR